MSTGKSKIAYAIARESSDDRTLNEQYNKLKVFAEKFGYEITEFCGDNVSGDVEKTDGADADYIKRLRNAIAKKKPDAIFVSSLDRFTRSTFKQGAYLNEFSVMQKIPIFFCKEQKWTIVDGKFDFDYINQLAADITPQKEREAIVARTAHRRQEVGEAGYFIGHLSDGYCTEERLETYPDGKRKKVKRIIVDEQRKGVIEKIFQLFLDGKTTDNIAKQLNAEKIDSTNSYRYKHPKMFGYKKSYIIRKTGIEKSREESLWTGSGISQILANTWYKGERKFRNKVLAHDYIIAPEIWEKVQAMRQERRVKFRTDKTSVKHNYLLGKLLFCGKCGEKMYGHYTGLNNHYYCSSRDNGFYCGSKGICKENIEAIIYYTITNNAFNDAVLGEKNEVTDFFRLSPDKEQSINKDITFYNQQIAFNEKACTENDNRINNWARLQGEHPELESIYAEHINSALKEKEKLKNEILKYNSQINSLERQLKSSSDIKTILETIINNKELETIKRLFESAIEKVQLFNSGKSISIIRINYKNGKVDEVLYSYSLMKYHYIRIHLTDNDFKYDEKNDIITWDNNYPIIRVTESFLFFKDEEQLKEAKKANEKFAGIENAIDYSEGYYHKGSITPQELITELREFGSGFLIPFKRLEELDERGIELQNRAREWRKQFNTGKTFTAYIDKDEGYEEIKRKCKHLYNRKYKIKNKVKISESERARQLAEIDSQLEAYQFQKHYLPTNQKGKKLIEKYNKLHIDTNVSDTEQQS